jgi:hypothetical protein
MTENIKAKTYKHGSEKGIKKRRVNKMSIQRKKYKGRIFLLFLVLFCFFAGAHAENLVLNSGFEKQLSNWLPFNQNGAKVLIANTGRTGKHSLFLDQTKPIFIPQKGLQQNNLLNYISKHNLGGYALVSQNVPVHAGKSYRFSFWYKTKGLLQQNNDVRGGIYAGFNAWIFWLNKNKQSVKEGPYLWVMADYIDEPAWTKKEGSSVSGGGSHAFYPYIAPKDAVYAQIRFELVTAAPQRTPKAWIDDVKLEEVHSKGLLPNPDFEQANSIGTGPKDWKSFGSAKTLYVHGIAQSGTHSVEVINATMAPSGWETEIPVYSNKIYSLTGFVKTEKMSSSGSGAYLSMQFLDNKDNPIGDELRSKVILNNTDWDVLIIKNVKPPAGAKKVQIRVNLQFCSGQAYFDNLNLRVQSIKAEKIPVVKINPVASVGIIYAKNLLKNGGIEEIKNGKPVGWIYHGSSEKNWTKKQLEEYYTQGTPQFNIGRGKGEISSNIVYAGKYALLNISIAPPLSKNYQWYGMMPVDGYWLSAPMVCQPGKAYIAGGWIRMGVNLSQPWWGPLEIQFFDKNGNEVSPAEYVRSGISTLPAGKWRYWATVPYIAPDTATTMRLRFGQELAADTGGWGKTYADNLTVWKLPKGTNIQKAFASEGSNDLYKQWFIESTRKIKPPYMPSPKEKREWTSIWGSIKDSVEPGNIFIGKKFKTQKIPIKVALFNLLGESRVVSVEIKRYDFYGKMDGPYTFKNIHLKGYSESTTKIYLPPVNEYGSFYLKATVFQGNAKVGKVSGRYGVIPYLKNNLKKPPTDKNIWAATPGVNIPPSGRMSKELGEILKIGGFGIAWVKMYYGDINSLKASIPQIKQQINWYRKIGLRVVLQLEPQHTTPIQDFEKQGEIVGKAFKGLVIAIGNFGVEEANTHSPWRRQGNTFVPTDKQYDTEMAAQYDGIKKVSPKMLVLIGNIATDYYANTIKRLYKKPGDGKFNGAILNAYSSEIMVAKNALAEFDKHGNKNYTVWMEEDESGWGEAPNKGPARASAEFTSANDVVKTALGLYSACYPRIKAITAWAFVNLTPMDYDMITPEPALQPRPQFISWSVMTNTLADATFVGKKEVNGVTIIKLRKGNGTLWVVWSNIGTNALTLAVSSPYITTMDIMGNRKREKVSDGLINLNIKNPVYIFTNGNIGISHNIEGSIQVYPGIKQGHPEISIKIKNNEKKQVEGDLSIKNHVIGKNNYKISIPPLSGSTIILPVNVKIGQGERTDLMTVFKTGTAAYNFASSLNFAYAVYTEIPPYFDGTWKGWEKAKPIDFGYKGQSEYGPYRGRKYLFGKIRFLWDKKFLYLGVEALDKKFVSVPTRSMNGFEADAIEFAFQPDDVLNATAPKYEYEAYLPENEAYLPGNGENIYCASRRFPSAKYITSWRATIKPTGVKGNVNYQIAIPWKDIGLKKTPKPGKKIGFALVLDDKNNPNNIGGGRYRIVWFHGIASDKNPGKYGDITLIK